MPELPWLVVTGLLPFLVPLVIYQLGFGILKLIGRGS